MSAFFSYPVHIQVSRSRSNHSKVDDTRRASAGHILQHRTIPRITLATLLTLLTFCLTTVPVQAEAPYSPTSLGEPAWSVYSPQTCSIYTHCPRVDPCIPCEFVQEPRVQSSKDLLIDIKDSIYLDGAVIGALTLQIDEKFFPVTVPITWRGENGPKTLAPDPYLVVPGAGYSAREGSELTLHYYVQSAPCESQCWSSTQVFAAPD